MALRWLLRWRRVGTGPGRGLPLCCPWWGASNTELRPNGHPSGSRSWNSINTRLLPMKGVYFFTCAATGCIVLFAPLMAEQLGMNVAQIGWMNAAGAALSIIVTPVSGILGDRFQRMRVFLLLLLFWPMLIYLGATAIYVSGKPTGDRDWCCSVTCPGNGSILDVTCCQDRIDVCQKCQDGTWWACLSNLTHCQDLGIDCDLPNLASIDQCPDDGSGWWSASRSRMSIILSFSSLIVAATALANGGTSLQNRVAYSLIDSHLDFGKQRLWASFGWGCSLVIASHIVTKKGGITDYGNVFYVIIVFAVADFVSVLYIRPKTLPLVRKSVDTRSMLHLLVKPQIVVFVLNAYIMGIINSCIDYYVFLLLDSIGAPTVILGTNIALSVSSEIVFFFASGYVIRRLGRSTVFYLCLATAGVRFLLYSLLQPSFIQLSVIISALHGVTFSLCYATLTSYADEIATPESKATLQGILEGTYDGSGKLTAGLLGGLLMEVFGGRVAFRIFSGLGLVGCVLHRVANFLLEHQTKASFKTQDGKGLENESFDAVESTTNSVKC